MTTALPLLPRETAIDEAERRFDDRSTPQEILDWAITRFARRITLSCSFGGPTGMVLLDMLVRAGHDDIPVFFLDTGLLFPETHDLVARVEARYGVRVDSVTPKLSLEHQAMRHGEALWSREPDACCDIRKVEPQRLYLQSFDALITGVRRDQASTRARAKTLDWDDRFGVFKIAPLATWSESDVWAYVRTNDVPYNALHDAGFPSAGCWTCTRAVRPGEDRRAGRWAGSVKTECGLHLPTVV